MARGRGGRWIERAASAGLRVAFDSQGGAAIEGRRYRLPIPYDSDLLDALAAARGPAGLVEDLLLAEEPDRMATRVMAMIRRIAPQTGGLLHWGSASGAVDLALARAGLSPITAYDSNPLWEPIARERLRQAGIGSGIVRVIGRDEDPGIHGLALVVGDPAHRQPPLHDVHGLARSVRPGGYLLLIAWPDVAAIPAPISGWPRILGADARGAWVRWTRPRGGAPAKSAARRWSGLCGSALAVLSPDTALRLLGERDAILLKDRVADCC